MYGDGKTRIGCKGMSRRSETLTGKMITLPVESSDSDTIPLPPGQCLIFASKKLEDGRTPSDDKPPGRVGIPLEYAHCNVGGRVLRHLLAPPDQRLIFTSNSTMVVLPRINTTPRRSQLSIPTSIPDTHQRQPCWSSSHPTPLILMVDVKAKIQDKEGISFLRSAVIHHGLLILY